MPQCPYNLVSSRSIAFYTNEYLLPANEHYERIPTLELFNAKAILVYYLPIIDSYLSQEY